MDEFRLACDIRRGLPEQDYFDFADTVGVDLVLACDQR